MGLKTACSCNTLSKSTVPIANVAPHNGLSVIGTALGRTCGEADWKPAGGLPPGRGLHFAASPASNDTEETYSLMLSRLIPAIRPNHLSCGYLYFSAGVRCGLCNLSMR